jgi:hypothetical protein
MVVEVGVVEESRDARELEAGRVRLDEEEGLLAVGDRKDDVEAGVALARHEPLLAVQHPLVAVADGCRGDGAHVRSSAGLRDRPGLPELAVQDGYDPAVPLLGREDLPELGRAAVDHREAEAVRRFARLLLQRHLAEHAQCCAARLFRHVQHREARGARVLAHLVNRGEVDRARCRDLLLQREDLLGDEAADALLQLGDVGGKLWDHHGAGS